MSLQVVGLCFFIQRGENPRLQHSAVMGFHVLEEQAHTARPDVLHMCHSFEGFARMKDPHAHPLTFRQSGSRLQKASAKAQFRDACRHGLRRGFRNNFGRGLERESQATPVLECGGLHHDDRIASGTGTLDRGEKWAFPADNLTSRAAGAEFGGMAVVAKPRGFV